MTCTSLACTALMSKPWCLPCLWEAYDLDLDKEVCSLTPRSAAGVSLHGFKRQSGNFSWCTTKHAPPPCHEGDVALALASCT